jgi:copper homeostasis protein (lipoprotein)
VEIANPGSPPFAFEIPYDADSVDERHTYSVRARITSGGQLLFTTDTVAPVLTRGAGAEVELLLKRVGGGSSPAAARTRAVAGSFVGTLPCADCEGIEYRLDLFEDGAFYRRMTYLEKGDDTLTYDIGSWSLGADRSTIGLFSEDREPEQWKVVDRSTLRKLDREAHTIESDLNYDLVRTEGLEPFEPRLAMRGMYMYMADAAMFRECLTGRRLPVAMEAASIDVERAYLDTPHPPGAEVLVSVVGRLAQRPPMEGDGTVEMLVVDEFEGIWPGETCGARMTVSELQDTYWKLTRLGDEPVIIEPQQREPHLVLRSDGQVTGFAGCNQLTGPYTVDGSMISFGALAMTQRACLQGMETEAAFAKALHATVGFRLLAHHLELLDEAGDVVARLEARELR